MSFALSPDIKKAVPLVQRSIDAANVTSTYTRVGPLFGTGVITLIIVSTFDEAVQISLDGVNDFIPILDGALLIIDVKSNKAALDGSLGVYVKELQDPITGTLYVSGLGVA